MFSRLHWILTAALLAPAAPASAQSDDFGKWITLFNGKDLTGWMNAKRVDRKDPFRWTVEDGAMTNIEKGVDDICTEADFENYELELEYKVGKNGNSGVYLRGLVEVQVFDSYGKAKLEPHDAGAIYGGFVALQNASKPAGEWNQFRIRHIGRRITVWHNGVLIQDNVYAEKTPGNMADASGAPRKPGLDKGPIQFQGDHEKVWYRGIRIRPLFSGADGWRPLWNGKDLSEFNAKGRKIDDAWAVKDNTLANTRTGHDGGTDIWTGESFGNFLVHYEYKSDPKVEGGNGGFYLRDQWEIQIFRETRLDDAHTDGCLYSIHTPLKIARNKPDQWNHMEVKVQGMKIWVWQNGVLLHDGRVCKTRTDNHGAPTEKWSKAPFKLQGDHGKVAFTNLFIKPLPDGE